MAKARAALEERQQILEAAEAALAASVAGEAMESSDNAPLWSLEPSMPTPAEGAIMAALLHRTHTPTQLAEFVAHVDPAEALFEQLGAEFTAQAAK